LPLVPAGSWVKTLGCRASCGTDPAADDGEEVAASGFGKAAVALGEVGADREGCAVELVGKKADAAIKVGGQLEDFVGEAEGLSVDEEVLELKRHGKALR
jgi:hypothetical protein